MGILDDKYSYFAWRKKQKKREATYLPPFKASEICECGKSKSLTSNLCKECKVLITKEEGIKFVAPRYNIKITKKTGIKCGFKDCDVLTENWDTLCFVHTEKFSKSKKYKTTIPKMSPEATIKRLSHDY